MKTPWYYSFLIALAKPVYRIMLAVNSEKRDTVGVVTLADEFTMRFAKRFPKKIANPDNKPCVWVHAVSLGETNTIAPIVDKLLSDGYHVVITNTTHTGYARVETLFNAAHRPSHAHVDHSFVVVDSTRDVGKFLTYYAPQAALFVETELWPNTLAVLSKHGIPSILVNARLSQRSYRGYARFSGVARSLMANLNRIICQDTASYQYFQQLGASTDTLVMSPSLKFAVSEPVGIREKAAKLAADWSLGTRQLIIAASTHEGEEVAMLTAFSQLSRAHPQAVLMIVPRHPERFESVANTIEHKGFELYRRSTEDSITDDTHVYLADSMGELVLWYALTQHAQSGFALVGGSLVEGIGGHNPLEASMLGVPVIMGPYTEKAQIVVNTLEDAQALCVVENQAALTQQMSAWLTSPQLAQQAGQAGEQVVRNHAHAVDQQYEHIKPYLP